MDEVGYKDQVEVGYLFFSLEWSFRGLRRIHNSASRNMRMRARAPKAPPMMELTGTFDLPCPPVATLAEAANVEPEEEGCCVADDEDEEDEDDNEEEDKDDNEEEDEGDNEEEDEDDLNEEEDEDDNEEEDEGVPCTIAKESRKSVPSMGMMMRECWPVGERASD